VPNLVSVTAPVAELIWWKKTRTRTLTHSLSHSLTQLMWCARNRSFCFGKYKHKSTIFKTSKIVSKSCTFWSPVRFIMWKLSSHCASTVCQS